MSRWGALPALALADFRDRVRRRSFLAVLAAAAFLGLQAIQGNVLVVVGGRTGEPSSAWAGALMTMVAATFLSLHPSSPSTPSSASATGRPTKNASTPGSSP